MRNFKRFYHVAKWAKTKQVDWRDTDLASSNTYGDTTPDCVTAFELDTLGYADGTLIGSVMVTYYVKFKGRVKDAA